MASSSYRGVVRGGMVVLQDVGQTLPEGTEVLITPLPVKPGTPAGVLAAMAAEPHVPCEWVDELEQLIAQGARPPVHGDPFAG